MYPREGWFYDHIQSKYKEAGSEPITMNDNYSYMTSNVSDFLIVETTYEQYLRCHPEYEFEDFALGFWLSDKDYDRIVRMAIPIL